MSLFGCKDPRWTACADPSWISAIFIRLLRDARAAAILLLCALLWYGAYVFSGYHARERESGVLTVRGLQAPVAIFRDARGVPHIRAAGVRDMYFAEGFVQGADRLFQVDLARRYAYGTLAEVFGAKALPMDEETRAIDARGVAARQWRSADASTRDALQAFSDGVNAAMQRQPLPLEFRMLLYRPAPWTPRDSIAVSLVAAWELSDSWHDVFARDAQWRKLGRACYALAFPLSDPRYDVTLDGDRLRTPNTARRTPDCAIGEVASALSKTHAGSNAWAAGAARTRSHRALVANDPHVDLTIPGIWYLLEMRAPGFHVAGAVIPGLPGVTLGHNEHLAWAVTNAQVATTVVYRAAHLPRRERVVERFTVRFASTVAKAYYRTADAFSVPDDEGDGAYAMVRWPPHAQRTSAIASSLRLDAAPSIAAARTILMQYRGSPENVMLADTSGAVAYQLAGDIPNDPAWGRYVHAGRDRAHPLAMVPFSALPARAASKQRVLLSGNNRTYGDGYPYRLSAQFELPYRAYRIAQLLHARAAYTSAYFARMQLDNYSPVDAEIAKALTQDAPPTILARWNGRFTRASRAASLEFAVRSDLLQQNGTLPALLAQLRSAHAARDEQTPFAAVPQAQPWGIAGRVPVDHPLSPFWYGWLRGAALPGDGNEYTIHLQEPGFAQGFRAVWEVGNWDAGGIAIPSGESGRPGSTHYDDLVRDWIAGRLPSLPFSDRAVRRTAVVRLLLEPQGVR